jgi:hypothetical protein
MQLKNATSHDVKVCGIGKKYQFLLREEIIVSKCVSRPCEVWGGGSAFFLACLTPPIYKVSSLTLPCGGNCEHCTFAGYYFILLFASYLQY